MRQIKNNKPQLLEAFSDEQIICAAEKIKAKALPLYIPELSRVVSMLNSMSADFQAVAKVIKGKEGKALKTLSRLASYNINLKTNEGISKACDLYCQAAKRTEDPDIQELIEMLTQVCNAYSTCTEAAFGAGGYAWQGSEDDDGVLAIGMGKSHALALPVQWLHQELTD